MHLAVLIMTYRGCGKTEATWVSSKTRVKRYTYRSDKEIAIFKRIYTPFTPFKVNYPMRLEHSALCRVLFLMLVANKVAKREQI